MSDPNKSYLKAPFPYFGGKSSIASEVWKALGKVDNYVEPFFGTGAVLLSCEHPAKIETVNDKDGFIANFWRAIRADPETVALHADWPVNENDLHARHSWLVGQKESITSWLEGDPEFYDAKVAGWWVWGICCWIGGGFCSGTGPWHVVNGKLVHLGDAGQGVNRQLVHLGNAGQGVNRKRVAITNDGIGVTRNSGGIYEWFEALSERLRFVRVCCGDFERVLGPTPTVKQGLTGVFLDPPYDTSIREKGCYNEDSSECAIRARNWAIKNGNDARLRIVLCGYDMEHEMPDNWRSVRWSAHGGYEGQSLSGQSGNRHKECLWLSPHCQKMNLFD